MLLEGKKALIFGVANQRSIAYGIASMLKQHGARLAFNYVGDAIKKRVEPISEELGGEFTFQCDVCDDSQIEQAANLVREKWDKFDILIHSVAFANREDLSGRFIDTSRKGFSIALDISAYSLTGLCRAFEHLFNENSSVITMTYMGSGKIVPGYNVMGVAKAALAASAVSSLKDIFHYVEKNAPLRRNVTPLDVGGAAVFLASDLSCAVTGEIIYVDSGFSQIGVA